MILIYEERDTQRSLLEMEEYIMKYLSAFGIPEIKHYGYNTNYNILIMELLEKIAEYKEAFDMIDKDKKGTISVNDITKIMKNFGYPISRKEVEKMVAEMDTSGSGELDFEEFVTLMQKQTQYIDESDEDQVLKAFKSFDKDHDGKITMYEFRYILSQLGDMFTEEECDTLFKECDLDNDGVLVYQDFINFWRSH